MWAESLYETTVGNVRTALLTLLGAVVFVLLIACANVANLLFARSLAREHEIAIRTAMGAGRVALVRQSLIEGLSLSCAGGLLGLFIAYAGLDALLALAPSDLPRVSNVGVDATVLLFALALSLTTGVLFWPCPRASSFERCSGFAQRGLARRGWLEASRQGDSRRRRDRVGGRARRRCRTSDHEFLEDVASRSGIRTG